MNKLIKAEEKIRTGWTKPVLTMIIARKCWGSIFPPAPLSSDCREPTYIAFQKTRREEVRTSNHFSVNKGRYLSLEHGGVC